MSGLKIITCNVRGLGDKNKRRQILNHVRTLKADIVFMQETHCTKNKRKLWRNEWGNQIIFNDGT